MKRLLLTSIASVFTIYTALAQNFHVQEDFNAAALPANWTNTAVSGTQTWSFGVDGSTTHTGNQNLDGTAMAYFDDDGLGGGSTNNTVELLSPVFNNATNGVTNLEFDYNFRQFNGINDYFKVEVFDGTSWNTVLNVTADDCGNYLTASCNSNFPHASIDISAFANASCQVRYTYHDGNDWGWYVSLDNVEIWSPLANDIGVSRVIRPTSGCGRTATDTVELVITNFGANPTTPFAVAFDRANGTQLVSENITTIIPPQDSLRYKFTGTIDISAIQTHNVRFYTIYAADGNLSNDTVVGNISNEPSFSPTYSEDFETSNGGWTVSGANPSWQRGIPATTNINSAASGFRAFVTDLTGAYNNNELSYLTSPCFDFSGSIGDPIMTFSLIYYSEAPYDFLFMESSIDNGQTWQKINAGGFPTNWYNNTTSGVWTGISNQWLSVENVLTGLGSQSDVKLRYVFRSDGSTVLQGVGIDKFSLRYPQAVDISMNDLIYPSAVGSPLCGFSVENITVELENKGANTINQTIVGYQVDGGAIFKDTINVPILSNTQYQHTFSQSYDFTVVKNYTVKTFATATGDTYQPNDTINKTVNNTSSFTVNAPYLQNFDGFTEGTGFSNNNDGFTAGWTRNGTSTGGEYTWRVSSGSTGGNHSASTTPDVDHTTGSGLFVYTEASQGSTGNVAVMTSPCVDLSNTGVKLEFWYHKYGTSMGATGVFVDVYDGTGWQQEAHILGQTMTSGADPFIKATVNLSAYSGRKIKVRFRRTSAGCCGGDFAIDDVALLPLLPQDASVAGASAPASGCDLTSHVVTASFKNEGTQPIAPNTLTVSYKNTRTNAPTVSELIPVQLALGQTYTYNFTTVVDVSAPGTHDLKIWTSLNGDTNPIGDTTVFTVSNRSFGIPYYLNNFEALEVGGTFPGNTDGWFVKGGLGAFRWHAQQGEGPNIEGDPMFNPALSATGPSGDHTLATNRRNGVDGKYMLLETKRSHNGNMPAAILESPCDSIDISGSINDKLSLLFWYHQFGGSVGDLFVDVYDGNQWVLGVGVVRGHWAKQDDDTKFWEEHMVNLHQFAGPNKPKIKIRFRALWGGSANGVGGDIGIDDITFIDRINFDVAVKKRLGPDSDCDLKTNEELEVELQNLGDQDIYQLNLTYQVVYTDLNGNVTRFNPVVDSAVGITILADAKYNFKFDTRIDMSGYGDYKIKIWSDYPGDTYFFNDTLITTIVNETQPFPSCQDWSELNDGDIPKKFFEETYPNDWIGNTSNYAFKAVLGTPINGNNTVGHTGGVNDIFLLVDEADGGGPGAEAQIESPCYDLTNAASANMEFYYIKPSLNQLMVIDIKTSTGFWRTIDSILPRDTAVRDWKLKKIVLADYKGNFVNFRFRAQGTFTEDAKFLIDDVCVVIPDPQQIELEDILKPVDKLCFYSDSEIVRLRLQNIGRDRIDSFTVVIAVDTVAISNPPGNYERDTFKIFTRQSPPFYNAGDKIDIDITQFPIDMSRRMDYFFHAYVLLPGDNDFEDNYILDWPVTHVEPDTIPRIYDFENVGSNEAGPKYSNRWERSEGAYPWRIHQGVDVVNITGPAFDHTLQTPLGKYFVTDGANGQFGDVGVLISPCLDLTKAEFPAVRYWYHMFGSDMEKLYLEVNDDTGWEKVDSITGQQQAKNSAAWKESVIDISGFKLDHVKLRFNSSQGVDVACDAGVDDIFVYNLASKNIAPIEMARPTGAITDCFSDTQTVKVRLRNFGADSLKFGGIDTLHISCIVEQDGVPLDTLYRTVTQDIFLDNVSGNLVPFPRDSFVVVQMNGTVDMSANNVTYTFKVRTNMVTDIIPNDDYYVESMLAQTRGGVTTKNPNAIEICNGTPIQLNLNNYWGAIRWESRSNGRGSTGFWEPGFRSPFDSSFYNDIPDTTSWYRARVCGTYLSDSIKVDVRKPHPPVRTGGSRCGPGIVTLTARANPDIDSVYIYREENDFLPVFKMLDPTNLSFDVNLQETDTFWMESITHDSCRSQNRSMLVGFVNPYPVFDLGHKYDSVCQDTVKFLNGGAHAGHISSYDWTIVNPDGSIDYDSIQTLGIDAWKLELDGTYKYHVGVTSDSGCVTISDTIYLTITDSCFVGIYENPLVSEISVFPNPTSSVINIEQSSISDYNGAILLSTIEGKEVLRISEITFGKYQKQIDVSTLPKGIYFLKFETEKGDLTKKIVIQ